MYTGLDSLIIFKAKGSVKVLEKYPSIYREDIDENCHFNPNDDYLYAPSSTDSLTHTSPWYGFTLIPDTKTKGASSLDASLYLMQFLNWAIYYYDVLVTDYNSIPKGRPKQQDKAEVKEWTNIYAQMIESLTDKVYTEEEIIEKTNLAFKRNRFPLKPSHFLKLCRFFARAWYEERFCSADKAVGSVEFAYYISNYIESSLVDDGIYSCKRYDGNDENTKKEVTKLFTTENKIEYQYRNFHILLEKHDNTQTQDDPSYTISVSQYGYKHTFYLFSRLYQHRYTSPIQ